MFTSCDGATSDWSDYTLVVPAVSVGNVGQLTTDLLISSLWMHRVGYFHDDSFLPVIGNDPYALKENSAHCSLMTACEVYESSNDKLVAIQQRSPLVKGKRGQYVDKLMTWIKEKQFAEVIIVTSTFAHERRDSQLEGSQLRFLLTDQFETEVGSLIRENLQWKSLEPRQNLPAELPHGNTEEVFMPGAGIAKSLFHKCSSEGLKCAVVLLFCSEGDNATDAVQLITALNHWKNWVDMNKPDQEAGKTVTGGWRIPASWRLQYGSRLDQTLFQ